MEVRLGSSSLESFLCPRITLEVFSIEGKSSEEKEKKFHSKSFKVKFSLKVSYLLRARFTRWKKSPTLISLVM